LGWCLVSAAIGVMAPGCTYDYGFGDRASYTTVQTAKKLSAREKGPVAIAWDPPSFRDRVDETGPSSAEGSGTKARIPTGPAITTRVDELMNEAVGVDPSSGDVLSISVIDAETTYGYAVGFIGDRHIDRAWCVVDLEFAHGSSRWSQQFTADALASDAAGGPSGTKLLEQAWDDVALQVTRSAVQHLPTSTARRVQATPVAAPSVTPAGAPGPEAAIASSRQPPVPRTTDADLERVIAAWPDLPEPVRAGIAAMVEAAMREKR
jgi:hypothetical protein